MEGARHIALLILASINFIPGKEREAFFSRSSSLARIYIYIYIPLDRNSYLSSSSGKAVVMVTRHMIM